MSRRQSESPSTIKRRRCKPVFDRPVDPRKLKPSDDEFVKKESWLLKFFRRSSLKTKIRTAKEGRRRSHRRSKAQSKRMILIKQDRKQKKELRAQKRAA